MLEIWSDAGDSFTKWLWNCDKALVWGATQNNGVAFEIGGLNPYTNYE